MGRVEGEDGMEADKQGIGMGDGTYILHPMLRKQLGALPNGCFCTLP